jgi:hypothetical protein
MFDEEKLKMFIVEAVYGAMAKFQPQPIAQPEKIYIHSIQGLADFLHFSIVTAQKLKNSGKIPYQQVGRKVIFEGNAVLAAMNVNVKKS